jgi:DNA repair ATPase RecN
MDAPPPPPKPEADKIAEKKKKMEATLNELDVKIKSFEETEKKFGDWLDDLRSKAKELIEIGKEADAKKLSDEAKEVYRQA